MEDNTMQNEAALTRTTDREREKKYKLRCETALWQKAALGFLILSVMVNVASCFYIAQERERYALEVQSLQLDVEIANAERDQALVLLAKAEQDKQFVLDEQKNEGDAYERSGH